MLEQHGITVTAEHNGQTIIATAYLAGVSGAGSLVISDERQQLATLNLARLPALLAALLHLADQLEQRGTV